jgi:hypothetical protein
MPHCYLSVDLEDYKHATMFAIGVPPIASPDRTLHGMNRILSVLGRVNGSGSMSVFTTGQVARDHPDLVAQLSAAGHEIGCHGDQHENVFALTRAEYGNVLRRAVDSIASASGQPVLGFRAPNFSIDARCRWIHELLAEVGIRYDSSVTQSGRRAAPTDYDVIPIVNGTIFEFPVYSHRLPFGAAVRVIGGTSFRILPVSVICRLMQTVVDNGYVPVVYLHPSDFDDEFEPVRTRELASLTVSARLTWALRQKQWSTGSRSAPAKLEAVLRAFPNKGPMGQSLPARAD